jgi:uncharacterized protein (TIGR03083 family)
VGVDATEPDLALLYRDTRERVIALVSDLDDAALNTWVPACPKWSVRDVFAHLTAVAEDVLAGRLARPPTEDMTAAQVARFSGHDVKDIAAAWEDVAPQFERVIGTSRVWPPVVDVVSHEHDIRGALGRPGARDSGAVWHSAGRLIAGLRPPVPMRVAVEDAEFEVGPDGGTPLVLTTSRFEALRWRMGRRSKAQLAALDWSGDPAPVLDHLAVFGPAAHDVAE